MAAIIPSPLIGVISEVFNEVYTHSDIDRLFAYADAPAENPGGNKVKKTVEWLRAVNKQTKAPVDVLGLLLEEILEKAPVDPDPTMPWKAEPEWSQDLRLRQAKIQSALTRAGLVYGQGGYISHASASPSSSIRDRIEKGGLKAVGVEVERSLLMVEKDPNAAAHYAANVLEAALKAYLLQKKVPFNDQSDTLNKLWELVRDDMGINPRDLGSKDLKKIASGLISIVEGTMYIRNKKSSAHGRTDDQLDAIALRPRHARLVIHSAHTVAAYVLECIE